VPPPPPPLVDSSAPQPGQATVSARKVEEDITPPPPPPEPVQQPGKPALPAATAAADAISAAQAAQDSARLEALKKVQEFEEDMLTHIHGDSRSRPIMRLTHSAMTGCSRAACHTRETCPSWSDAQIVSSLCCLNVWCGCIEFGPVLTECDACRRCHNGNPHWHGIYLAHLSGLLLPVQDCRA
jgi:hypothetical protein